MEDWFFEICDLFPETVLSYQNFEQLQANEFYYSFSKEEFESLQNLYQATNFNLKVLNELLDCVYCVIGEDWDDLETPYTPSSIQYIEKAEQILKKNTISLPQNEQTMRFLMGQHNKHLGKPFDGLSFSEVLIK